MINYHAASRSGLRFALDIGKLDSTGRRATGLYPDRLDAYAIFGDTVVSPVAATVVWTADGFRDHTPPDTDSRHPFSNHVVISRDSVYIVFAYLKNGSIRVSVGDSVEAGDPIARVGNSGNTTEPHLHIHAVVALETAANVDSLMNAERAVPLSFEGRVLVRSDRFP